jgi:hypothetical protein
MKLLLSALKEGACVRLLVMEVAEDGSLEHLCTGANVSERLQCALQIASGLTRKLAANGVVRVHVP